MDNTKEDIVPGVRFSNLYKLGADWSHGRQPKNHLSMYDDFNCLCSRKQVESMGGVFEYRNGKWYSIDITNPGMDVEVSKEEMIKSTCAYCYASACSIIHKQTGIYP